MWSLMLIGTGYIQVMYLGRAPRTKETLPDFREKCRVTRHSQVFPRVDGWSTNPRDLGRHNSGANINLMPLSMVQRLSLGELTPTTITLQMADRSMAQPEGVLEDVLVKVGKFIFPVDFVVIKMEEDT